MATYVFPKNLGNTNLNPGFIQFQYYQRGSFLKSAWDDTIALCMPDATSQPSTVSWDNEKFGFVGKTVTDTIQKLGSNGGGVTSADMNAIVEGAKTKVITEGSANLTASAVNGLGGNISGAGILGEAFGKVPNPYLTAVFRGIDFRTFSFVFKFAPMSESDCTLIDNIIKCMRKNSLPDYLDNKVYFNYPKECQISYHWQGKENGWLHGFKRAVCTGIDVDYAPNGHFSALRNGFPTQIVVSTKWSEIEVVTRSDIDKGF